MLGNDPEMQAIRAAVIVEQLDRATDEYRASRQARDAAKQVFAATTLHVDTLIDDLYREITGRELSERFMACPVKRKSPPAAAATEPEQP